MNFFLLLFFYLLPLLKCYTKMIYATYKVYAILLYKDLSNQGSNQRILELRQ
jgi:hypothetical protein